MKPAPFQYHRATSMDGLFDALDEYGEEACILAGGQSLVPLMNLRMATPEVLIDINGLDELSGVVLTDGMLRIGALTRHVEVEASPDVRTHAPLIAQAMPHIAHAAIRNRGTFGGSLALADPAAELPACCVALEAELEIASRDGVRRVAAADFFLGAFETALGAHEVLVAGLFPRLRPDERSVFLELARRQGDYALAGLAAHARVEGTVLHEPHLVFFGVEDRPIRVAEVEVLLSGPITDSVIRDAQSALERHLTPNGDPQTSAAARKHLSRVLLGRAVSALIDN